MIHKVKGFGIVNKAEVDVFLELSCFSHDPADVGNLISGSSAFSKTSLNIRKFTVHVHDSFKALLKDQGVGGGPYPGNLHPFPKIVGIILPLINIRNCLVYKN